MATKSLHLSVVREKRLLRPLRSVNLNLNARLSFNIIVAIYIDSYSFLQKEVIWTDQILYGARNTLNQLLIGALASLLAEKLPQNYSQKYLSTDNPHVKAPNECYRNVKMIIYII
jgi:hypothetical protein